MHARLYAASLRLVAALPLSDAARRPRACSPARSGATTLLPTGFMPARGRRAHRHRRWNCRRARALDDTTRDAPTRSRSILHEHAGGALGLRRSAARIADRRSWRCATRRCIVNLTPKSERDAQPEASSRTDITAALAEVPDMRAWYVNERGERELSLIVTGHRRRGARRSRRPSSRARCAQVAELREASSQRRRSTGRRSASCRGSTMAAALGVSTEAHRPRRCASPPSATSTPTSPSSTPATARSRSACSSTRSARADLRLHRGAAGADRRRAPAVPLSAVADVELRPGPVLDRPLRPRAPRR